MSEEPNTDRPVNAERGEIAIVLDGEPMCLRPSSEAILAFEAATGKSLIELSRQLVDRTVKDPVTGDKRFIESRPLTLSEITSIATECIRAWGRAVGNKGASAASPSRIRQLILDSDGGVLAASQQLGPMLVLATTGGYSSKGEVKAVAAATEKEAATAS